MAVLSRASHTPDPDMPEPDNRARRRLAPIDADERMFRDECALPPLPAVTQRIRDLLERDECSTREVARLVESEPLLVARVLRMVNSAYYGLPRQVTDIRFAIAFVGLGEVYRIVMALAVIESIGLTDARELEDFWFHSYLSALIAKHAALRFEPHLALDELWPAALLHDIGRLVYARFFPDHLRAIRVQSRANGDTLETALDELGLPSFSCLGALLCEHWALPETVRGACAHHRLEPAPAAGRDGDTHQAFLRMVAVGHVLSELCLDELRSDARDALLARTQQALGCGQTELLDLIAKAYELRERTHQFVRNLS